MMYHVVPGIKEVVRHKDRIFRWYSDGKVEYCDLDSSTPIFKQVGMEPVKFVTVTNTEDREK